MNDPGMIGGARFGRIWAMIVKEMWAVLRDPRARISLVLPPIIQLFILGFANTLEVKNITIGVLDNDGGYWSSEFVSHLAGSPNVSRIVRLQSPGELQDAIDNRRIIAAVAFQSDFSGDVAAGRPADVQVIFDGRRSNASQIVAGYVERIAADVSADIRPNRRASHSSTAVTHWFNPNLEYLWFTMPALIVLIGAVSAMVVTSQAVARERELGTFEQLMVSPLLVHEILIGKLAPPFLIGLFNGTLYLILIPTVFGVPFMGSVVLFYLAFIPYLLSMMGLGMLVSSLCRTQQQAFLGDFMVVVPVSLLSGFASPVDNMPHWLQLISLLNPLRHFMAVAEGLFLKGMPAIDVFANTWPLVAIAAVTLAVSAHFFRSRME